MVIMTFVILIVMFFLAINGKNRGVVNYKFTLETVVLTLVIMPNLAVFIKEKLIAFLPEMLAAILGVVLGLIIVFLTLIFILGKIAKIPEYEYTSSDKTLGFFTGALKGFTACCALIAIYGITFVDLKLPSVVTKNMKENFANNRIQNSIEYYRYTVYKIYRKAKSSDVSSLTQSSREYYGGEVDIDISKGRAKKNPLKNTTLVDTSIAGYVKWVSRDYSKKSEAEESNSEE